MSDSYEASNWFIKMWRTRWYFYAIFLYLKCLIKINIIVDYIIDNEFDNTDKDYMRSNWKTIKKHVELNKMHKYSTK
jgi:hypothetical protein